MPEELNSVASNVGQNILSEASSTYASVGEQTNIFLSSVRTYIAGVLMPTLAVSISASFDQSPTARITLPADPRLFNLGRFDRLPVQVFVQETMVEAPQFILMFEGYVAGRSYLSMANQREINLECIAFTDVFKDTKLKFMTSIEQVFMSQVPGNEQLGVNIFVPGFSFPGCLFMSGLGLSTEANGGTTKLVTMPTEYLANILAYIEEAATKYAPAGRYNDSIVAKYFATLAYNLRFDRRFCWLPYFDTEVQDDPQSKKGAWEFEGITERGAETATMFPVMYGLKADAAINTIDQAVQDISNEFTMDDLLRYLVERMEYEFLVIPAPAYHAKQPGEDLGLRADKERKAVLSKEDLAGKGPNSDSPVTGNDPEGVKNIGYKYAHDRNCERMVNFCLKPMLDDSFPPQCNIIFRSQVDSIQATTTFNRVPTRIQVSNFNPFGNMSQMTGSTNDTLAKFGSVDFYPSKYYGQELTDLTQNSRSLISEDLLDTEQYTGPWVHRDSAPSWMFYAFEQQKTDPSYIGSHFDQIKKMREQYMRRQLTRAQTLDKQLSAQCVFLPYVTCGFPAVVYDSGDTGFSFAGNVIAYEHTITPQNMSTSVVLNGVRLLAEAVEAEDKNWYPNPINSIHVVTHNTTRLKKVYDMILGTPGASVSGATPVTWADVKAKWSGTVDNVATSPQTNIYEAYKLQRRNIITFDDYCSFMGLTKTAGDAGQENVAPTEITNAWMEDRAKITVFEVVPLRQTILPVSELELRQNEIKDKEEDIKKLEEENKQLEEQIKQQTAQDAKTTAELQSNYDAAQVKVAAQNTEANVRQAEAARVALSNQKNKSASVAASNEKLQKQIDANKKQIDAFNEAKQKLEEAATKTAEQKQGFSSDGNDTDVRALLKAVREEEMQHNIY